MLIKKRNIESFLPVFSGFYESIFAPYEDNIIEEPYNFDDYEFEYDTYRIDMAKACVNAIESELKPLGITVTYQSIQSPRFYNFETDSINVLYKLSPKSAKLLNAYLLANKEAFTKYIKDQFTSRDGFISWYSNDVNDWFNEYTQEKLSLTFGTMLEFYFVNEGYTQHDLYNDCDSVSLQGGLKTGVYDTINHIEQYANDNYVTKAPETLVIELTQYFEANDIQFDWLTFSYIENIVNRVFNDVAKNTLNLFASVKK